MAVLRKDINLSLLIELCEKYKELKTPPNILTYQAYNSLVKEVGEKLAEPYNWGIDKETEVGQSFLACLIKDDNDIQEVYGEEYSKNVYNIKRIIKWVEENNGSIVYDMDGVL